MKLIKLLTILLICGTINSVSACVRIDLKDRSPEEVVKKSLYMGRELEPAKITGAVLIVKDENGLDLGAELCTGVAIDPFTVLTAAHGKNLESSNTIQFVLSNNALEPSKEDYCEKIEKVIIHQTFKRCNISGNIGIAIRNNEIYIDDIPTKDLDLLTFDKFLKTDTFKKMKFSGVDLAILKLQKPLPEDLKYPDFLDENTVLKEKHGISIGFGLLRYNNQDKGPQIVSKNQLEGYCRHVISCKVSTGYVGNNTVLHGNYKGLLINGNESFIPDNDMQKTEGLPVGGDSGGPLFIKNDKDKYVLGGIFSDNYSPWVDIIEDKNLRELLGNMPAPVFPTWHTISSDLKWIKENMGKF